MLLPVKLVFVGNRIDGTLMGLDILFDLLQLADCILQFRLAYVDEGRLETDYKKIRLRYLYGMAARGEEFQPRRMLPLSLRGMRTRGWQASRRVLSGSAPSVGWARACSFCCARQPARASRR